MRMNEGFMNGTNCCKGDVQGIYLNVLNVLEADVQELDVDRQSSILDGSAGSKIG